MTQSRFFPAGQSPSPRTVCPLQPCNQATAGKIRARRRSVRHEIGRANSTAAGALTWPSVEMVSGYCLILNRPASAGSPYTGVGASKLAWPSATSALPHHCNSYCSAPTAIPQINPGSPLKRNLYTSRLFFLEMSMVPGACVGCCCGRQTRRLEANSIPGCKQQRGVSQHAARVVNKAMAAAMS